MCNGEIATFRTTSENMSPEQRVDAVRERIDKLPEQELGKPVTVREGTIGNQPDLVIYLGATPIFGLLQSNLDPFF